MSEAAGVPATQGQTGDPRVDDALARLGECAQLSLAESIPVYEDVHRRLREVLSDPAGPR